MIVVQLLNCACRLFFDSCEEIATDRYWIFSERHNNFNIKNLSICKSEQTTNMRTQK